MATPHNGYMTNYQEATFNLAGEGDFYGIHDPSDTWNGFSNPLFTLDVVREIARLVKEQNSGSADEVTDQLIVKPNWHPNGKGVVSYFYAEDGTTEEMPTVVVGGVTRYAVMNYCWCWGINSRKVQGAPSDCHPTY